MSEIEFKPWPKIPRESPFKVTITEKINGSNGCIILQEGKIVAVQSRNQFITPEQDNFGFAKYVQDNTEQLLSLGDGYHYGEWAGEGINRNPHKLVGKHFFLFNTFRWNKDNPNLPKCCSVVPILYEGTLEAGTISEILTKLEQEKVEGVTPEGVVVYYHAFKKYTKHTIISPNGKWCKE